MNLILTLIQQSSLFVLFLLFFIIIIIVIPNGRLGELAMSRVICPKPHNTLASKMGFRSTQSDPTSLSKERMNHMIGCVHKQTNPEQGPFVSLGEKLKVHGPVFFIEVCTCMLKQHNVKVALKTLH